MKKSAKVQCCSILVWIVECWNSLLTIRNPKTIDVSPAFWSRFGGKDHAFEHMQTGVIQKSRRWDSFLHEAAQNFELLSNIEDQK